MMIIAASRAFSVEVDSGFFSPPLPEREGQGEGAANLTDRNIWTKYKGNFFSAG
jgi:hypothetical protein